VSLSSSCSLPSSTERVAGKLTDPSFLCFLLGSRSTDIQTPRPTSGSTGGTDLVRSQRGGTGLGIWCRGGSTPTCLLKLVLVPFSLGGFRSTRRLLPGVSPVSDAYHARAFSKADLALFSLLSQCHSLETTVLLLASSRLPSLLPHSLYPESTCILPLRLIQLSYPSLSLSPVLSVSPVSLFLLLVRSERSASLFSPTTPVLHVQF